MNYIFRSIYNNQGAKLKTGIWRSCATIPNITSQCINIECPKKDLYPGFFCSKIIAVQAFVTIACIMSSIAAVLLFATAVISDNKNDIRLIAGRVLTFICLVMGTIGVAIGINVTNENGTYIGLGWGTSAIIGIFATIIDFCGVITSLFIQPQIFMN